MLYNARQYTPPTPTWVASASAVWTEFATRWRLPTDSVDNNLETDQTDSTAAWLREFWSILITFSTMTSLCRHMSPTSIAQQHRKCKLCHDYRRLRSRRRHDATRLRCWQIWRQLVANCVHTADATQLDSWVASAVCIGFKTVRLVM